MKFQTVFFDLDDTLYDETTYVRSGFQQVAEYLAEIDNVNMTVEDIFYWMLNLLASNGRGKIFNDVLKKLHLSESTYLSTLIFIYRNHIPVNIKLNEEMKTLIHCLHNEGLKTGILTDGTYVTQKNKTDVLFKDIPISCIIHTDLLGLSNWKPSQEPFRVALNLTKSRPEEVMYIGDNPQKDFKGANQLKIATLWWNPEKLVFDFAHSVDKPMYESSNTEEILKIIY